jgi:SAM-dependent methyltransferase
MHETVAERVSEFYERYPYPPPRDDLKAYQQSWDSHRRRAESHLFWPSERYREDRSILVAGCGTMQAAHYAIRWPNATVIGVDVSAQSLAFSEGLKRTHGLDNLELRQLPIDRVADLEREFDYVVCTGVLHHLADPDAGLRALRAVLGRDGAINLMVYAPYGRAGVYMLQDYCRRIDVGSSERDVDELAATLKALPPDHPIASLLRSSPDFADKAGLADALLHPQDRAYDVPELMDLLDRAGLAFGRWLRQAPYIPWCGALASSPHQPKLAALPPQEQYAAIELFRGTMVRHTVVAYHQREAPSGYALDFEGDAWLRYIPIRLPDTIELRERLPDGAAAVLINRNHTFNDLYLPIDAVQERLLRGIDSKRTIAQICGTAIDPEFARTSFQKFWRWDQVVFDASAPGSSPIRH